MLETLSRNRPATQVEDLSEPSVAWAQVKWVFDNKNGALPIDITYRFDRWFTVFVISSNRYNHRPVWSRKCESRIRRIRGVETHRRPLTNKPTPALVSQEFGGFFLLGERVTLSLPSQWQTYAVLNSPSDSSSNSIKEKRICRRWAEWVCLLCFSRWDWSELFAACRNKCCCCCSLLLAYNSICLKDCLKTLPEYCQMAFEIYLSLLLSSSTAVWNHTLLETIAWKSHCMTQIAEKQTITT